MRQLLLLLVLLPVALGCFTGKCQYKEPRGNTYCFMEKFMTDVLDSKTQEMYQYYGNYRENYILTTPQKAGSESVFYDLCRNRRYQYSYAKDNRTCSYTDVGTDNMPYLKQCYQESKDLPGSGNTRTFMDGSVEVTVTVDERTHMMTPVSFKKGDRTLTFSNYRMNHLTFNAPFYCFFDETE